MAIFLLSASQGQVAGEEQCYPHPGERSLLSGEGDARGPARLRAGMGTAGRWQSPARQEGHGNVTGLVLPWSGQAFLESQKIQPWVPNGARMGDAGERPNPRLRRQVLGRGVEQPIACPLVFPMAGNDWE